jgi:hypothetical protein
MVQAGQENAFNLIELGLFRGREGWGRSRSDFLRLARWNNVNYHAECLGSAVRHA